MTKLEERLNQLAGIYATGQYEVLEEIQCAEMDFKAGARAVLEMPELNDLIELLERSLEVRIIEVPEDNEVKALGERIGFGALLDSAVKGWHQNAKENGYPPGGAFTVGHCHATVENAILRWRSFIGEVDK